jgi:hypothetical protein
MDQGTNRVIRLGAAAGVSAALIAASPVASAASSPSSGKTTPTWHRYDVPVKGRANIQSITATGRDNAWAAGFEVSDDVNAADRSEQSGAEIPSADSEECGWQKTDFSSLSTGRIRLRRHRRTRAERRVGPGRQHHRQRPASRTTAAPALERPHLEADA